MLNYSYNSYGKDYLKNAHEIFLLNPDATPKELLQYFPPTRIMGGTYDPLRDQYVLFFMKLQDAGVDVKFTEYMYYPHSFLNFSFPVPRLMCSCSKHAINRVCFWANEGIYGSAVEAKVEPDEEEKLAEDFKNKKDQFNDIGEEQINRILNSRVDDDEEEEKKEESDSDDD